MAKKNSESILVDNSAHDRVLSDYSQCAVNRHEM